jgi:hypothetical protein
MEELPVLLGEAGMAGAFIAFLVFQSKQQSKRMDELTDRLMQEIMAKLDHILEKVDQ